MTGKIIQTIQCSTQVKSAKYSPDGEYILFGSEGEQNMHLGRHDTFTSYESGKGGIFSVDYSPNGAHIVAGGRRSDVIIWNKTETETETDIPSFNLMGYLPNVVVDVDVDVDRTRITYLSVKFSPDGTQIVSASWDHTVKIWSVATGACLHTLEGHTDVVSSAEYSPDGKNIVSGSWDNTVKVWNAENGECLQTLEGHTNMVKSVKYSPDGKIIVSASRDSTVKIWNVETGYCIQTITNNSGLNDVDIFSPYGLKQIHLLSLLRACDVSYDQCVEILSMM
jgi:WD40 repeat protein